MTDAPRLTFRKEDPGPYYTRWGVSADGRYLGSVYQTWMGTWHRHSQDGGYPTRAEAAHGLWYEARPSGLLGRVYAALDNALANGYLTLLASSAERVVDDLKDYDADLQDVPAADLLPHVQSWQRGHGVRDA